MNQDLPIQAARAQKARDAASFTMAAVLAAYAIGLALAETVAALSLTLLSFCIHALLVMIMLIPAVLAQRSLSRRLPAVFALISITRLMSIALLANRLPRISAYLLLTALFLVAIGTTVRALDFSPLRLGLRLWSWPAQLLVGLSGLPLSLAAYLLLSAQLQSSIFGGPGTVVNIVIILSISALAEELLFRGLLQAVLKEFFGTWGLIPGAGLFALTYASLSSWNYVVFLGIVGLFFGWCAHKTGSIHGVALAHGIMLVGSVCIWPVIFSQPDSMAVNQFVALAQIGAWLCAALLLGLAALGLIRLLRRAVQYLSQRLYR